MLYESASRASAVLALDIEERDLGSDDPSDSGVSAIYEFRR